VLGKAGLSGNGPVAVIRSSPDRKAATRSARAGESLSGKALQNAARRARCRLIYLNHGTPPERQPAVQRREGTQESEARRENGKSQNQLHGVA
jgi:hypothetical protein